MIYKNEFFLQKKKTEVPNHYEAQVNAANEMVQSNKFSVW